MERKSGAVYYDLGLVKRDEVETLKGRDARKARESENCGKGLAQVHRYLC